MKIAISSTGKTLDSEVDARFGRCPYFTIIEIDKKNKKIKKSKVVKNKATQQAGGAGITAAEFIGNKEVEVVITMSMGPKAFSVMQQLGIKIYQGKGKIKDVVKEFIDGRLKKLEQATGPVFMGKKR